MDGWTESISARLGTPVLTNGDEVRFNCWRNDCGSSSDTKYHLYVNPRKGRYFCQRCQRGGTLDFLAKVLNLSPVENSLHAWDRIIQEYIWGSNEEIDSDGDASISWPSGYHPISKGFEAHKYLSSRGISDERISFYDLGFGGGKLIMVGNHEVSVMAQTSLTAR